MVIPYVGSAVLVFLISFIDVRLIHSAALVSGVQQSDSVVYVYVCTYICILFRILFHSGLVT